MKKTIIIGLSLVLGLALVATVALAWGPGFGPGFGRGFGGPAYGSPPIPNLTAEQSAQIQALRDGFLKEIEPLQKDLYDEGTELRNLWSESRILTRLQSQQSRRRCSISSLSSRRRPPISGSRSGRCSHQSSWLSCLLSAKARDLALVQGLDRAWGSVPEWA